MAWKGIKYWCIKNMSTSVFLLSNFDRLKSLSKFRRGGAAETKTVYLQKQKNKNKIKQHLACLFFCVGYDALSMLRRSNTINL